jgi:hypothetical protein
MRRSDESHKPQHDGRLPAVRSDDAGCDVRRIADASISTGASCRTPCSLAVPVADALTVSYEFTGYLPQTVPVHPLPGESGLLGSSGTATQFDPNPVFAALQPATPSKPPPPKKRKGPTTAAAPPPAAPPPSMGGFAPPPDTFTPMIR